MPKQQTKKLDIRKSKVVKPLVVIPIVNEARWQALRVLHLIRQLEAVAEIDPTKINVKDYVMLVEKYTELNMKYGKEKRERRNLRDQKADKAKKLGSGVDGADVEGGSTGPPRSPFVSQD